MMPKSDRPHMPKDYGIPESTDGLLPWSHVVDRMTAALNYWFCTVRPNGTPHAVPAWAAWLDDTLYYDGSPETQHNKNVVANPRISVHLEDGTAAVMMEGIAQMVGKPDPALATRIADAYCKKYGPMGYCPKPDQWDAGGLYLVKPTRVLAWTQFPKDCTRWRFDQ
jgi:hypothetical protein